MQRRNRHGWLAPAAALLGAIAIFPGSAVAATTAPPIPHAQHPHSPPGGHRVIHARPRTSAPKAIRASASFTSMVYDGGTLPNLQGTDVELASGGVTHSDGLRFGEFASVAIDPAVSDSTCAVTTNQSFLAPNGVWQTDLARLCSPSQVQVPSVAGDTVGTARTALANASLRGDNLLSSTACTAASQGLVLSTDPPAGNTAEIGTEVTLTVCNLLIAVPNLTGLDQGTAESRITGAGLAIGNENPDFRCLERQGIVVSQTPAPGSSVMRGTPVNINVSTGTKANGNPCIFK